jgi:50S ribosomal protein L16 3-hydroxylase
MTVPDRLPGGLPVRDFLHAYWQKKPLLIRAAFPDYASPVTPEELAGLALEEEAESRLILERGGDYPWQLRCGPFQEEDFIRLPASHWTLLVQEVDRWIPGVAELLERFLFVPAWRLDDVMVSYATDGGSVGAHVDNYDVFLIQALGRREWHIGMDPAGDVTLVPDVDVSMLADFEPDQVMTLEEGDMLYLPPRVPHHGIAVGESMTFSVGFRAPGHDDLVAAVLAQVLEEADPLARYSDPDIEPADHPGRIGPEVLQKVRRTVRDALSEERIARGFGVLVTRPKQGEVALPSSKDWSPEDVALEVEAGAELVRVDPNRFAFIEHDDGRASLFVHGEAFELDADVASAAPLLAGRAPLDAASLEGALQHPDVQKLLARLVRDGHLDVRDAA